jgi:hypothetical protein
VAHRIAFFLNNDLTQEPFAPVSALNPHVKRTLTVVSEPVVGDTDAAGF